MPVSGSRQQVPSTTRPADMAPAAGLASNGLGSRNPGAAIAAGAKRRPRQPPGGRAAGGQQPAVKGTVKTASATANPAGSLHNVLAKNAPLFRSLFTVLDISADQVPASAVGTLFAPSDDVSSSSHRQGLLQRFPHHTVGKTLSSISAQHESPASICLHTSCPLWWVMQNIEEQLEVTYVLLAE